MVPKRTKARLTGNLRKRILEQTASVTIRVTDALKAYYKRWASIAGHNSKEATAGRTALETFKDLTEALGYSDWLEVVQRAHAAGQLPGQYIAALVRATLTQDRKGKR